MSDTHRHRWEFNDMTETAECHECGARRIRYMDWLKGEYRWRDCTPYTGK